MGSYVQSTLGGGVGEKQEYLNAGLSTVLAGNTKTALPSN